MTARDSKGSGSGSKPILRIEPDGWYSREALMDSEHGLGIGNTMLKRMKNAGLKSFPSNPQRYLGKHVQEIMEKMME